MFVAGLCLVVWASIVWQWQDPFTAAYTKWQQARLAPQLERRMREWRPTRIGVHTVYLGHAASARAVTVRRPKQPSLAAEARRYRESLREGEPFGRIVAPRLGLHGMIVMNGTDHDSLTKGPGRYLGSYMPGEGKLVYLAGHRTTYLAPFAGIDSLRTGDRITLELPYATFTYAVVRTRIVRADDLSVLRSGRRDELVLQACHPRFFATHRYLAYARLVRVRAVEPRRQGSSRSPVPR